MCVVTTCMQCDTHKNKVHRCVWFTVIWWQYTVYRIYICASGEWSKTILESSRWAVYWRRVSDVRCSCCCSTEPTKKSSRRLAPRSPWYGEGEIIERLYCRWSHMGQDVEALVQACLPSQSVNNASFVSPLHPWLWPRVCNHVDFAGPFQKMFMHIVDAQSKSLCHCQ